MALDAAPPKEGSAHKEAFGAPASVSLAPKGPGTHSLCYLASWIFSHTQFSMPTFPKACPLPHLRLPLNPSLSRACPCRRPWHPSSPSHFYRRFPQGVTVCLPALPWQATGSGPGLLS